MRKLFLIIFPLLFVISCQKNNNPISPENVEQVFPEGVGDTWTYSYVDTIFYDFLSDTLHFPNDSIDVERDTITVKVVLKKVIDQQKKEIVWQVESKTSVDTIYLTHSSDTLFFEPDNGRYFPDLLVLFLPLKSGAEWEYLPYDYKVKKIDSLNLPFEIIKNLFAVKQILTHIGNSGGENIFYIKNGIGIVKLTYNFWDTMINKREHKIWQLLNFSFSQ